MKKVRTFFVSIMLTITWFSSFGVVNAPTLRRVCVNYNDTIATLEWSQLIDACGSFSAFHIYGRPYNTSSFQKLHVETDPSSVGVQFKLPELSNSWEFYIEVLNTCDGQDSVSSNTLLVDGQAPDNVEIDSVSVDYTTQKTIIGWRPNPSDNNKDVKGYSIKKRGTFDTEIGDTNKTVYLLYDHDITIPIRITMSAYDSCNIPSTIGNPHSIIRLNGTIDTCANEIYLDWTAYEGWDVSMYGIYVSRDGLPYTRYLTTNNLNYTFSDFTLGENLCFFIRGYKDGSDITSSSRYICFATRKPVAPTQLYISNVTVTGESLTIQWRDEPQADIVKFALYRLDPIAPGLVTQVNRTGDLEYTYIDNNINVNTDKAIYQIVAYDKCDNELSRSNQAGNILLTITDNMLSWNPYALWFGTIDHQEIWIEESSTWNIGPNLPSTYRTLLDQTNPEIERCYQVKAIETNNPFNTNKVSESNVVCRIGQLTFYIPNAINRGSENNTLKIIGTYIDYEKSNFSVYNRWGQKIYECSDVRKGWDGTIDGQMVPMGIYFYVADIWGENGERQTATGEIQIIR